MKNIALVSVYAKDPITFEFYASVLHELLSERKPRESISHKELPSFADHIEFVKSKPYKQWYLIQDLDDKNFVGCCYLGKENNIGISIFEKYRRQGYATAAIETLMDYNPQRQYIANINPLNGKSRDLFESLGFTYAYDEYVGSELTQTVYILNCDDA